MKFSNLLKIVLFCGIIAANFSCTKFFAEDPITEMSDPKTVVESALKNFLNVKSYHSVVNTKNANISVETEVDFIAPDKYWIRTIYRAGLMKRSPSETTLIPYQRRKWLKSTADGANSFAETRNKMTEDALATMKDFAALGKEELNGKEVFVYTFKSNSSGEASSKMWIDAKKVLPLRVDTNGNYNDSKIEMSISYDYEKEIKIEAPMLD